MEPATVRDAADHKRPGGHSPRGVAIPIKWQDVTNYTKKNEKE